jgi:hypothetical protein
MISLLAVAAALAFQTADTSQSSQPVSVDRIREALARPVRLKLTVPPPVPDFSVEIQERRSFPDLPPWTFRSGPTPPPWSMPTSGFTTPSLFSVDLLSMGRSVGNAVRGAQHDHAEHAAQQEVQEALRIFCATHDCTPR